MLVLGPPVSATADSLGDTSGATARLQAVMARPLAAIHSSLVRVAGCRMNDLLKVHGPRIRHTLGRNHSIAPLVWVSHITQDWSGCHGSSHLRNVGGYRVAGP